MTGVSVIKQNTNNIFFKLLSLRTANINFMKFTTELFTVKPTLPDAPRHDVQEVLPMPNHSDNK